jgi:peptidoglycan/LPS O-acetylase OafA/YrhL
MTAAATGSTVPGVRRFAHVDAMRAAAVLLVVLAHSGLDHVVSGGSGVTIFFTISGFIITYLVLRERDRTGGFAIGRFYLRRALKIGPPLLLVVLLPSLALGPFRDLSWPEVASQALFSYNWLPAFGAGTGVLDGTGVVWSLAIEEQFYIAFAIVWLLAARRAAHVRILAVTAAAAIGYATIARLVLAGHADRIYYGTDTRIDGIAWGILAALVLHAWLHRERGERLLRLRRFVAGDAALLAAVVIYVLSGAIRDDWFRDTFRYTLQSVSAAIVILYGFQPGTSVVRRAFTAITGWRWVQWIGLASYSIYLVHLPALRPVLAALDGAPRPVAFLAAVAAGVGAGLLLYRLVEVPFEKLRRRLHREADRPADVQRQPAPVPRAAD